MKGETHESGNIDYIIREIPDDMGDPEEMTIIEQSDGDVVVVMTHPQRGVMLSMEFCTRLGGGRYPIIAQKLRELVAELRKELPNG